MSVQIARTTATTATANGTLLAGKHNPVDATSGTRTMTLPSPTHEGAYLSVEKVDSSANAVILSGSIRGVTTTINLTSQYESIDLFWNGSTWRPISDHKTKAALDSRYATIDAGGVDARRYVKWDGTTDDTAGIIAALTAAKNAGGGDVIFPVGIGLFSGLIQVPDGVNILGMGNGKGAPATTFKATAAAAELRWGTKVVGVGARGGVSGHFLVDGNNIARNPFRLQVTVQRTFEAIDILAGVDTGLLIEYAQNNLFSQINVEDCVTGTGIVLDNGTGGNLFVRCESNNNLVALSFQQTGTDSMALVGYPVPTHNRFIHCIFERPTTASTKVISHTAGSLNFFDSAMVAGAATYTNPLTLFNVQFDGTNTCGPVYFLGGQLQGPGISSNVTGIAVSDGASLSIRQSPLFVNLAVGVAITDGAFIDSDTIRAASVAQTFTGNYDAYMRFRLANTLIRTVYGAANIASEINWQDNFPRFRQMGDGMLSWFPGTGYAPDVTLYRSAVGALSVDGAFRPGRYSTPTRPSAAAVGAGAMIYDTTIEKPIWSNGTVWKDATGATV